MSHWIRVTHRWSSVAFTLGTVVNVVGYAVDAQGALIGMLAFVPLMSLLVTGAYLFALPYATKWRRRGVATA